MSARLIGSGLVPGSLLNGLLFWVNVFCCSGGPLLEQDYFQAAPTWQWLILSPGISVLSFGFFNLYLGLPGSYCTLPGLARL